MTFDEEQNLLAPFFEKAKRGGLLIVTPIKIAYEEKTGRTVAESTIYRMLARHNWRKLAPDTRHPKSNPKIQEEYKKILRNSKYPGMERSCTWTIAPHHV